MRRSALLVTSASVAVSCGYGEGKVVCRDAAECVQLDADLRYCRPAEPDADVSTCHRTPAPESDAGAGRGGSGDGGDGGVGGAGQGGRGGHDGRAGRGGAGGAAGDDDDAGAGAGGATGGAGAGGRSPTGGAGAGGQTGAGGAAAGAIAAGAGGSEPPPAPFECPAGAAVCEDFEQPPDPQRPAEDQPPQVWPSDFWCVPVSCEQVQQVVDPANPSNHVFRSIWRSGDDHALIGINPPADRRPTATTIEFDFRPIMTWPLDTVPVRWFDWEQSGEAANEKALMLASDVSVTSLRNRGQKLWEVSNEGLFDASALTHVKVVVRHDTPGEENSVAVTIGSGETQNAIVTLAADAVLNTYFGVQPIDYESSDPITADYDNVVIRIEP